MVLFPVGGLGRVLVASIILFTITYLVLNIVSFAGAHWVSYSKVPVRFGLWIVCDTTGPGLCNSWSNNGYATNNTNKTFQGHKPGFIRTSQALEIISFIFYVFAALLIAIGILDLDPFPFEMAFAVAIGLLFICIVFISATLGVMSVQGRSNEINATLDWSWGVGLAGLIITIITFFELIFLIVYVRFSTRSASARAASKKGATGNNIWSHPAQASHPMAMNPQSPPVVVPQFSTHQQYHYPAYNNSSHQHSSYFPPQASNYYPQQHHPDNYWQQNYSDQFYQNPMLAYGGQSPAEQYFHNPTPSPIVSEIARQYVYNTNDAQYANQLLDPYRQYLHDPYLVHDYL